VGAAIAKRHPTQQPQRGPVLPPPKLILDAGTNARTYQAPVARATAPKSPWPRTVEAVPSAPTTRSAVLVASTPWWEVPTAPSGDTHLTWVPNRTVMAGWAWTAASSTPCRWLRRSTNA
jgi:hypothetical protein